MTPEEIKNQHAAGKSLRQLAKITGYSRHKVRDILGDDYLGDHRRLSPVDLQMVYDLSDMGHSHVHIAKHMQLCERTVQRALKSLRDSEYKRLKREASNILLKAGWPAARISRLFCYRV